MFWTEWGSTPKIERAYLNGKNRQTIVSSSIGWPNGITLDLTTKTIYWVDADTDKIESADYSGNNRAQIFHRRAIHPFGVALFGSWLFWTNWIPKPELNRMDRKTGSLQNRLSVSGIRMGVSVFDSSVQPSCKLFLPCHT